MTPSHAVRLAKYGHQIIGGLPALEFKQAKFIGKALGIKQVHRVSGGYHPGKDEYELVEALNEYNYHRSDWERVYGSGTTIKTTSYKASRGSGETKRVQD